MVSYHQGMLDDIHRIDYLCNDIAMEPEDLHRQYRDMKVCVKSNPFEVVGFYIVNQNAEIGRISRFCVNRRYQRQYIGTIMMDELLKDHCQLKALTCVVNEYNLTGQLFLKQFGFRFQRFLRQDGQTNYLFIKDFEP